MARQHFASDLGVARLIGAEQADHLQSGKKQEAAECDERNQVGGTARAFAVLLVVSQVGSFQGDGYCTLHS